MRIRKAVFTALRAALIAAVFTAALCIVTDIDISDDADVDYLPLFSDVPDELKEQVETVYKSGIIGASGGGVFGTDDKISANEAAYIAAALYEELNGIERSHTWYSSDIDIYIETAEEYGLWTELDRAADEYITRDDAAAILGAFVDDTYPVYGSIKSYDGMSESVRSDYVLKLYNCGITLDRDIAAAFAADVYATREDMTRLVCMIMQPDLRLTDLKRDYTPLETALTEQMSGYEGDWSLYFKEIRDDGIISINSHKVYSASLIKLYVIQAVYTKINSGELNDSESTENLLTRMITWSDNDAWKSLARLLGGGSYSAGMAYVTDIAQSAGFADTGTFYEGNRKNYNFTSVNDCGKYLEMLLNGLIVSPDYSSRILELMKRQEITRKIPAGIPDGVVTANKTGELEYMQGDAAIVYAPSGTYILVVIADSVTDISSAAAGITALSKTVYEFLN